MIACEICGQPVPTGSRGVTCGFSCRAKLREARKTTEWRKPREYPTDLVEQVRHLYIDRGMTRQEVQSEIGPGVKVELVLRRHGIPRRRALPRDQRGPANPAWAGATPSYHAAHSRVVAVHGKATSHACVDCEQPAKEWSYIGGCPEEQLNENGLAYSPNPNMYAARCVPCHRQHDAAKRRTA